MVSGVVGRDAAAKRRVVHRYKPSGDLNRRRKERVLGANALAFEALALFPCFAAGPRLMTTGFRLIDRRPFLCWSLWGSPNSVDTVRSYLALPGSGAGGPGRAVQPTCPVGPLYRAERVANGDYSNLTVGRPVEG
jgi:hypothetical protein